jgi:uncharacterized membrane protein YfcA
VHLDVATVAIAFAAVITGASVQGSIGFGMNLVVVPVLALVEPEALPAVAVLLGLPLSVTMFRHEPHAVDRSGLGWILVGRVPGTALGAWIVTAVSALTLSAIVGVAVLAAVAMSVLGTTIEVRARSCLSAGVASGVMNTAAGIGGPPLALLYQHHEGPVVRSTLAASFFVGTLLSTVTLAATGSMSWTHVGFGAALAPAAVIGAVASRLVRHRVDAGWLRPAVLGFAALSAVVTIVNSIA